MKIGFCWNTYAEAEIPEDEVIAILNCSKNDLELEDAFTQLAKKYHAMPIDEGNINGVYNCWYIDANGDYVLSSEKFDETIWES